MSPCVPRLRRPRTFCGTCSTTVARPQIPAGPSPPRMRRARRPPPNGLSRGRPLLPPTRIGASFWSIVMRKSSSRPGCAPWVERVLPCLTSLRTGNGGHPPASRTSQGGARPDGPRARARARAHARGDAAVARRRAAAHGAPAAVTTRQDTGAVDASAAGVVAPRVASRARDRGPVPTRPRSGLARAAVAAPRSPSPTPAPPRAARDGARGAVGVRPACARRCPPDRGAAPGLSVAARVSRPGRPLPPRRVRRLDLVRPPGRTRMMRAGTASRPASPEREAPPRSNMTRQR